MEPGPRLRPGFAPRRTDPCLCGSGRRFKSCCGSLATDRAPPYGVSIVHNFLDGTTCAAWIDYLAAQPAKPLATLTAPATADAKLREEFSAGRITDIVKAGTLRGAINDAVARAFRGPVAEHVMGGFEWFEHPQVLRYSPGGRYGLHADAELFIPRFNAWARNVDRDMSLLLYLNEDFEGGGLSFVHFNWLHRPRTGDLLFFPSDNRYCHQAETVRRGERWVIASWAARVGGERVHPAPTPDAILL